MLMTIGGKMPLASSGWTMDSPSLTLSCTLPMASPTTWLPAVSRVMLSAWRIGTPLVTSVPSVRLKPRDRAFAVRSPKSGIRSLILSMKILPPGVLENIR